MITIECVTTGAYPVTEDFRDVQVAYDGTVQLHRHGLALMKDERRAGVGRQVTLADRAREHVDRPSLDVHDPVDGNLVVSVASQLPTTNACVGLVRDFDEQSDVGALEQVVLEEVKGDQCNARESESARNRSAWLLTTLLNVVGVKRYLVPTPIGCSSATVAEVPEISVPTSLPYSLDLLI